MAIPQFSNRRREYPGRTAERPQDIPTRAWKDVFWRVWGRISEDRVLVIAGGIVFYGLLALFPALAALVSIYGIFANPADLQNQLANLSGVLQAGQWTCSRSR